jgi:monothiol glutaredoxin
VHPYVDAASLTDSLPSTSSKCKSGVEFKSVNVLASDAVRSAIKRYTEWPTIPQVFVKGEFIGGCDIILAMHQSGELSALFEAKGLTKGAGEASKP